MLALLHTARVHVETFARLASSIDASVPLRHEVRPNLLAAAIAEGVGSTVVQTAIAAAIQDLATGGAKVIVCTCSTIGGIAELVPLPDGVRVMRIDRPMAEQAVTSGRRIIVVAALRSTVEPTWALLRAVAAERLHAIDLVEVVSERAWPFFEAGDHSAYLREIAATVEGVAGPRDLVLLAQASMAPAAELLTHLGIPVLSSPKLGLEAAIAMYRGLTTRAMSDELLEATLFIEALARTFPDVAAAIDPDVEAGLLHLEMATLARATQEAIDSESHPEVEKHFRFADELFRQAGPDLKNAFYVSYLEHLDFTGQRVFAEKLLPAELRAGWIEINAYLKDLSQRARLSAPRGESYARSMSRNDAAVLERVMVGVPDPEIITLEVDLRSAQLTADVDALDRLISEDLLFTGPDGQLGTKAQDLAAHRSGVVRIREHQPIELRVRRIGSDVAIAALRTRLVVEVNGATVRGTYRYTRVWAREQGTWRVAGGHVAAVPSDDPPSS
jgi:ketosteroid isomerase-like protein